ncbi:hypothetical protein A6V29_18545 [Blastococcus sp. CCUG 61487]|nr:hypothetical protein A6V29_18545 [Blastococcus sp. CCUG 61487]
MVIPPVDRHGVVPGSRLEYADQRLPRRIGRYTDDEREVRPLGYYNGPADGPCLPPEQTGEDRMARWGRQRHLFDVLYTSGQQRYGDNDEPTPVELRMVLTCVRCGVVMRVQGQADSDEDSGVHEVTQLDPAPLQAGPLVAQQVRADRTWAHEVDATWAVYRDGTLAGSLTSSRGPRGRRFVSGRLYADGQDVEGPSAMAVLRKLAATASAASA